MLLLGIVLWGTRVGPRRRPVRRVVQFLVHDESVLNACAYAALDRHDRLRGDATAHPTRASQPERLLALRLPTAGSDHGLDGCVLPQLLGESGAT